jgi:hypothetical protein
MPFGPGKATGVALEVGKYPIAALVPQFCKRFGEMVLIIHCLHPQKLATRGTNSADAAAKSLAL